jgi:hypothetical protein
MFESDCGDPKILQTKKIILSNIFNNLLRQTFNEEYRKNRIACSESSDPEIKQLYRQNMLKYVKKMLNSLNSFVDIDSVYQQMIDANIYSDESTIRNIFNDIIQI